MMRQRLSILQAMNSPLNGRRGRDHSYYTAHLNAYLDVERINALSKGISVGRRYVIAEDNQRLRRVNSATVGGSCPSAAVGDCA